MTWKHYSKPQLTKEQMYATIRRPVITEKATIIGEHNQMVFEVSRDATKAEIKAALEGIFAVKVLKVNTITMPAKARRFRNRKGMRPSWRKAIATLKEGDSIDVTTVL